jgi:hypothetical protein
MSKVICVGLLLGLAMLTNSPQAQERPRLAVTVHLQRTSYLLGEPINVTFRLRNQGDRELRLWKDSVLYGMPYLTMVWWSQDGKQWTHHRPGDSLPGRMAPDFQPLAPGGEWEFTITILYMHRRTSGLLFELPGRYFLRVEYPYLPEGPKGKVSEEALFKKRVFIESEPMEIRIDSTFR